MKRRTGIALLMGIFVLIGGKVFAQGLEFSGMLDSNAAMAAGAGDAPGFSWGLEEYANIRLQAKVRDLAAFYGSLNLIAASGTYAQALAAAASPLAASPGFNSSALAAGENYAAALELERLYFKLSGEKLDFQGGLMRLAFGYGFAFGPADFLNPRNPLLPDARPRAALALDAAFYPGHDLKVQGFTAAARNPFAGGGQGTLAGLAGEWHGDRLSVQGLYAYESPISGSQGLHRFGLSLKGDLVLGLAGELLYTWDPQAKTGGAGLSAGFDYSFLDGKVYVLAEYLYSGDSSDTSRTNGYANNHYLYVQGLYRYSDYTGFSLGCMAGLEDAGFTPMLGAEHELFQGFTLSLSCQIPLDRSLGGGERGEFGPIAPGSSGGSYLRTVMKARLRF
ncbi:MAG: hypothetical protein LBQ46_00460 [Treponema sp.]|nr:hypothetical protein [Treponema sp.]